MKVQDLERYSRQLMISEIGEVGQRKLKNSKVLIIGAGGLGSPVAYYLCAAGIGTIGIADGDIVEISNLQRQILHSEETLAQKKVHSAKIALEKLNSNVIIQTFPFSVDDTNILSLIKEYDIIVDATDRFENKFLINDACVLAKKPYVHGGIHGFKGQLFTYIPSKGPCYRCIFEDIPKNISDFPIPVLGAVAGVIGSLQAIESIKYILDMESLLVGKILTFDGFYMQFRTIPITHRRKTCRVCGKEADIKDLSWYRNWKEKNK